MASKMSTASVEGAVKPSPTEDGTPSDEIDTNISIELITVDDAEDVLKLLKKFFFKVR